MDIALVILNIVVGLYPVGHGSQKFFDWFGGPGLKGTISSSASS
jgi:putative oxidoreductase